MIRAHRVKSTAQDDASLIAGWNVAPNIPYILRLLPGPTSCGVLLYSAANVLIATGAALVGADRPCVLLPQTGQSVGMVDADLGWHLLVTTIGTESQREIRINPAVDLPDEIHPVYGDENMALARATAAIDEAAHYRDDVTVSCPLGLGAGLGDVVSAPVDGAAVVGQVESVTWTATPDGATEQAVIRRHVAIAPEAFVEPVLPTVVDDTGETDADTVTTGNVLANDDVGLTVVAVNWMAANVGQAVAGSDGGVFMVAGNGEWTFDPDGDFAGLAGSETATTSVTYHASDGAAEAVATLTVVVSAGAAPALWTPSQIADAVWIDADTVTLDGSAVTAMTDKVGGTIMASQGTSSARPTLVSDALGGEDVIQFDGGDYLSFGTTLGKPANWTVFVVGMWASQPAGGTFICGSINSAGSSATAWGVIGAGRTANDNKLEYQFGNGSVFSYGSSTNQVISNNNWFMCCRRYTSGQDRVVDRVNGATAAVTPNTTSATSTDGTAFEFALGRFGALGLPVPSGSRLKGFVCVPATISDADAARLEGYYAHLCGLAGLLPADHPYKSSPPTI